MGKMAKCKHTQWTTIWRFGLAFTRRCVGCSARLPLGPANDNDPNVQIEIRAARLHLSWTDRPTITDLEYDGWKAKNDDSITLDSPDALAGWLSHEMSYSDTDGDVGGWPWDPSRPVAGQYEEWRTDADIAALESDPVNQRIIQAIRDIGADVTPPELTVEQVVQSDDPDPATKFGEMARQVVVPVTEPLDRSKS